MHSGQIALVVGTRPEAIKLAPIARALIAHGHVPCLVLTGQHPLLEPASFGFPALPAIKLDCRGTDDPHGYAAALAEVLEPHLRGAPLVLVQGDTSSALGGALAGQRAGVPIGHVEAGLRSHDSRHPWPEEEFRIGIDRIATLLFAPTELGAANLRRERVAGAIHVTGNTGIDAALARRVKLRRLPERSRPRLLMTCHRRESWGDGLVSIAAAVRELAREGLADIRFVLHPNPAVASAMSTLLQNMPHVVLQPPCSHDEMLGAMLDADLILSDSGGMQEEAPVLGVPLLVLRERTERPEAVASGNIELVGTGTDRILATVRRLLNDPTQLARMSRRALPYGDGRASERIAAVVTDWLRLPSRREAA